MTRIAVTGPVPRGLGIFGAIKPEIVERFRDDGVELVGSTPAEFRKHVQAEIVKWTKVVKAVGIQGN